MGSTPDSRVCQTRGSNSFLFSSVINCPTNTTSWPIRIRHAYFTFGGPWTQTICSCGKWKVERKKQVPITVFENAPTTECSYVYSNFKEKLYQNFFLKRNKPHTIIPFKFKTWLPSIFLIVFCICEFNLKYTYIHTNHDIWDSILFGLLRKLSFGRYIQPRVYSLIIGLKYHILMKFSRH